MRFGIRGKLVGTLMVAGLLPLVLSLVAVVYAVQQARARFIGQSFRAMAREHAEHMSTLLAAQIDFFQVINHLPGTARLLRAASSGPVSLEESRRLDEAWPKLGVNDLPLKEILSNDIAQGWQAIQRQQPRMAEALVTDRQGRLVAATAKTTDYYQADEDWWRQCTSQAINRPIVSGPVFDETAISRSGERGTRVINIVLPIYDPGQSGTGELIGVAKVSLEVGWVVDELRQAVRETGAPMEEEVWLIDGTGQPIGNERGPLKLSAKFLEEIRVSNDGYTIGRVMGDRELIGYSRMTFGGNHIESPRDWMVLVVGQRSLAMASTRFLIWTIVLVGAGAIACCFVAGWWLARKHLIGPLFELRHGANELEQGHLDYRLKTPGQKGTAFNRDEMGELAEDFNHMAGELERSVEALAKANRLKQQFIDVASHELQTPITYLLGVTELAQRQGSPERALLAKIQGKTQRLARVVENMFKLIKSGVFEATPHLGPVDVAELAAGAAAEVEPFLKTRGQTLDVSVPGGIERIDADAEKLRDILNNLLTNAIRFSPDGGRIGLEVRDSRDVVEMIVSDSGPGITPEDLPHVFEPFYRGQQAMARHRSGEFEHMTAGIGLGLSVVKRFTELHGGTVAVESDSNGTRFIVTLPKPQTEGADESGKRRMGEPGRGRGAGSPAQAR